MQDRWIIFNLLHFIFNKYFLIFLQCLRSLKKLFELWNAWKKEEKFRTLDFTAHEVVRWFLILLHKEKHVGTLFFHIFLIILAERVIKPRIFSFPIKPATVVWIGFMNKRGKFPYFGLYSPWSCAPGPLETGSSVVPPTPAQGF